MNNCASRAVRHRWRQIGVRLLPIIQLHMECEVCKATKWVKPAPPKPHADYLDRPVGP